MNETAKNTAICIVMLSTANDKNIDAKAPKMNHRLIKSAVDNSTIISTMISINHITAGLIYTPSFIMT